MPNDVAAAQTKHVAEVVETNRKLGPSLTALLVSHHPRDARFVRLSSHSPPETSMVQLFALVMACEEGREES
jgi:hypothetical protein